MAESKVNFTSPDPFKGDYKLLCTWLFRMNEYTELCGITISTEKVKMAVLGLDGAALIWWESAQGCRSARTSVAIAIAVMTIVIMRCKQN